MNTYVIFIDDELYESSDNFEIAKYLYNTFDARYNGHKKFLMARIDGINYHIKSEIISQSANNAVRHASPAMKISTDGRVNDLPEKLAELIKEDGYMIPVRMDENTIMYVCPNPTKRAYNPLATSICRRFNNLANVVVGDVVLCLSGRA